MNWSVMEERLVEAEVPAAGVKTPTSECVWGSLIGQSFQDEEGAHNKVCLNKLVSLLAKHNLQKTTSASPLDVVTLHFLLISAFALQKNREVCSCSAILELPVSRARHDTPQSSIPCLSNKPFQRLMDGGLFSAR